MFDINLLKNHFDTTVQKLKDRHYDVSSLPELINKDNELKSLMTIHQNLNNERNVLSNSISQLMKEKKSQNEIEIVKNKVLDLKNKIDEYEAKINFLNNEITNHLLTIPNICADDVIVGEDENDNVEIKKFSTPTLFDFEPLPHWELAKNKKLFLADEAIKLTGSRFVTYYGNGARLYRALQQFTLDENVKAGFIEVLPQEILNEDSLIGSGQLPKFKDDLFKLEGCNYYLSPTAEVQLVNLYRNTIIDKTKLPIFLTANTSCFRSEAGSAGRDTKGVVRLHQFHKSELVCFSTPNDSEQLLEKMTRQAETILEKLNLPYRRIMLCTGDIGFSSNKTYDIEVWLPSYNSYKEISSCSNCIDFQARRAKIRFKDDDGKNKLVHTLNGSSLAIDRLWTAVVENYQQNDGSIVVPDVLRKYMDNLEKI